MYIDIKKVKSEKVNSEKIIKRVPTNITNP